MELVILWLSGTFAVMVWAEKWQRSSGGWGLLALFLSPLLAALFLAAAGRAGKTCPQCAEKVLSAALVCKHCKHEFDSPEGKPLK